MKENNLDNGIKLWLKHKKYEKHILQPKKSHICSLWTTHHDLKAELLKIKKNQPINIEGFRKDFHVSISYQKIKLERYQSFKKS